MTKNNTHTNPLVVVCHTNEEIVGDLRFVLQRDPQRPTAFGATKVPSDLRTMFRLHNPVKVLVIEQAIEPRETEQIWNEVTDDPSLLVVVVARSVQEQKRIKPTERRVVLGPNADSTRILDAIRLLRIRRGQKSRAAFETGVIWLDPSTGRVRVHNRNVKVPDDEFQLLQLLADQPFRTFPKDELAITLTGGTAIQRSDIRYVEKLAHRLRHTLATAHVDAVIESAGLGFQLFFDRGRQKQRQPRVREGGRVMEGKPTLTVDPLKKEVQVNGLPVALGRNEYQLIEELSIAPMTGVSYREIAVSLSTLRGPVTTNQVNAIATSARRKLRAAGIKSPLPDINGIGLRLGV